VVEVDKTAVIGARQVGSAYTCLEREPGILAGELESLLVLRQALACRVEPSISRVDKVCQVIVQPVHHLIQGRPSAATSYLMRRCGGAA
jgi:hypothetical protein